MYIPCFNFAFEFGVLSWNGSWNVGSIGTDSYSGRGPSSIQCAIISIVPSATRVWLDTLLSPKRLLVLMTEPWNGFIPMVELEFFIAFYSELFLMPHARIECHLHVATTSRGLEKENLRCSNCELFKRTIWTIFGLQRQTKRPIGKNKIWGYLKESNSKGLATIHKCLQHNSHLISKCVEHKLTIW